MSEATEKPNALDGQTTGLPQNINFTLYEILRDADEELANYYIGALWALANPANPERYILAAHSFRELIMSLPYKHKRATSIERPDSITSSKSNLYTTRDAWREVDLDKENPAQWTVKDHSKGSKYLKESEKLWDFIEKNYPTRTEARLKMVSGIKRSAPLPPKLQKQQIDLWGKYYAKFASIAHHEKGSRPEGFLNLVREVEEFLIRELDPRVTKDRARISKLIKEVEKGDDLHLDELLRLVQANRPNYDHFFFNLSSSGWLDILRSHKLDRLIDEPKVLEDGRILTPSWVPGEYYVKVVGDEPDKVFDVLSSLLSTKNPVIHMQIVEIAKNMPQKHLEPINKALHQWLRNEYSSNSLLPFKVGEYIVALAEKGFTEEAVLVFKDLFELQEPKEKTRYFIKPETLTSNSSYKTILDTTVPILIKVKPVETITFLADELVRGLEISKEDVVERDGYIEDYSEIWWPDIENIERDFEPNKALITTMVNSIKTYARNKDRKKTIFNLLVQRKYKIHLRIAANMLKSSRDAELKQLYKSLVAKIGEPNHADFITQEVTVTPAISLEEAKKLSTKSLVELLNNWDSQEHLPGFGRSREDIGQTLSKYVQEDPGILVQLQDYFDEIKIDYIWHIFSGVRIASDSKTAPVNWSVVIELGKRLLAKTDTKKSDELERQAQFDLINALQSGLNQDHIKVQNEHIAEGLINIFTSLCSHIEPTAEYEAERYKKESGWNPVTLSINTMRGEAIEGLIDLLRNASRNSDNKIETVLSDKQIKKIFQVLDEHLDTSKEKTLSVRTVYGRQFSLLAYVNRQWVESNLTKIFPTEKAEQKYFITAIETFLNYSKIYPEFFSMIKDQVIRYMQLLRNGAKPSAESETINHLVGKILIMYIDGHIDLDDPLFVELFQMPAPYLEEALEFLIRGCKQTTGKRRKLIQSKTVEYWERRLRDGEIDIKEYEQMGIMLAWTKIDEDWLSKQFLDALDHTETMDNLYFVADRLEELASTNLDIALTYFMRIIETQSFETIRHMLIDPELKKLLSSALSVEDKGLHDQAERIIDKLVELGFYGYAELLENQ